jgi:hypothetical protein
MSTEAKISIPGFSEHVVTLKGREGIFFNPQ